MRSAGFKHSAIASRRVLARRRLGDGTGLELAELVMRRGDKLIALRVESSDGLAVSARLGPIALEALVESLTAALEVFERPEEAPRSRPRIVVLERPKNVSRICSPTTKELK